MNNEKDWLLLGILIVFLACFFSLPVLFSKWDKTAEESINRKVENDLNHTKPKSQFFPNFFPTNSASGLWPFVARVVLSSLYNQLINAFPSLDNQLLKKEILKIYYSLQSFDWLHKKKTFFKQDLRKLFILLRISQVPIDGHLFDVEKYIFIYAELLERTYKQRKQELQQRKIDSCKKVLAKTTHYLNITNLLIVLAITATICLIIIAAKL